MGQEDSTQPSSDHSPEAAVSGFSEETSTLLADFIAKNRAEDTGDGSAATEAAAPPTQSELVASEPGDNALPGADAGPSGQTDPQNPPEGEGATANDLDSLFRQAESEEDRIRQMREEAQGDIEAAQVIKARLESFPVSKLETLRQIVAEVPGVEGDEGVEKFLEDLYQEMTSGILGLEVNSSESKALSAVARLQQEVARLKQKEDAENRTREAEATKAKRAEETKAIQGQLGALVQQSQDAYPYLAATENPGAVLYEVTDRLLKAGRDVTVEEAAKLANQHIQTEAEKFQNRFRHLLNPPGTQQTKTLTPASAGQQQTDKRASIPTLTNQTAAQRPTSVPTPEEYNGDDDAWEDKTLAMYRRLQQQGGDA